MLIKKSLQRSVFIAIILAAMLFSVSCDNIGDSIDPADWGYESLVTYDALGGQVNAREVRQTYYMENSYIFEPAGTTNMLIQPVKDGYVLAGWYTAKEDIYDENGNLTGYEFRAEDRWDFDEDRVQGDMTLYARWVERARVEYVDAETGAVMFAKNLTADSPIQPLSGAAENLIQKQGHTLLDYFADEACTIPYDFAAYVHAEIKPANEMLFARLQEEFPDYIVPFEHEDPEETQSEEEDELIEANPDLYINRLGYSISTDDETIRAQIRARKDEIIDQYIEYYIENTADRTVYLKYIEGDYLRLTDPVQLKDGSSYSFAAAGGDGIIVLADIDFSGLEFDITESFSGQIFGNDHTLSNIELSVTGRKADMTDERDIGLFVNLDNAIISDLHFENLTINANFRSGTSVNIGAFAVNSSNSQLENISFQGLTIDTGRGDDGAADYVVHDFIANSSRDQIEGIEGTDVTINSSDFAEVNSLFIIPEPDATENAETEGSEVTEVTEVEG